MDYGRLFVRSWNLVWRQKLLWLLGFIIALGPIATTALRTKFLPDFTQIVPEHPLAAADPLAARQLFYWLIGGTLALAAVSIGYWLIVTVAQGGIIGAVMAIENGKPVTLKRAIQEGFRLLGRFIAIDTLVFFPLFLLTLLILLLVLGLLIGILLMLYWTVSIESMTILLGIGLVCLLPLFCLSIPILMLTSIYRTLAFRDAALRVVGARDSIRHVWLVIRQHTAGIIILAALIFGIQYGAGLLLGLMTALFSIMARALPTLTDWEGWMAGLVTAVPLAILHTFTAVTWTLAYFELLQQKQ